MECFFRFWISVDLANELYVHVCENWAILYAAAIPIDFEFSFIHSLIVQKRRRKKYACILTSHYVKGCILWFKSKTELTLYVWWFPLGDKNTNQDYSWATLIPFDFFSVAEQNCESKRRSKRKHTERWREKHLHHNDICVTSNIAKSINFPWQVLSLYIPTTRHPKQKVNVLQM